MDCIYHSHLRPNQQVYHYNAFTVIVSSRATGQSLNEFILMVTSAVVEQAVDGSGSVIKY